MSRALQSQPKIQQSLQDIQHILNGLEEPRPEVQSKIESLREDKWKRRKFSKLHTFTHNVAYLHADFSKLQGFQEKIELLNCILYQIRINIS